METNHDASPERPTKKKFYLFRALLLMPLFGLMGCASAYDCYPCGQVSCGYCPPNPLPYTTYQPCNCNDSIGQTYAAGLPVSGAINPLPAVDANMDYYQSSPKPDLE